MTVRHPATTASVQYAVRRGSRYAANNNGQLSRSIPSAALLWLNASVTVISSAAAAGVARNTRSGAGTRQQDEDQPPAAPRARPPPTFTNHPLEKMPCRTLEHERQEGPEPGADQQHLSGEARGEPAPSSSLRSQMALTAAGRG